MWCCSCRGWDLIPLYPFPRDACMSGFGFAVRKGNDLMLSGCLLQLLFFPCFFLSSRHFAFTLLCPPAAVFMLIELFLGKPCVFLGGKK